MSLKSKLGRLGKRPPITPVAVAPGDARGETLAQLREQMNAILERPLTPKPPRANPSETQLPFFPHEVNGLIVHRRLERVARSKTVGRIPVDAAADADAQMLSLLALDPRLLAHRPRKALYLDTETTGLGGGAGTLAFLLGLAWFDDEGLVLEQLLLMSPAEEPALLYHLEQRLQECELLVTFNGKSFDWPLLQGRYVMNHLPVPASLPHLDLLHIARRLHKKRVGSVTLKRLESEVLGLERGPDIDGAEIGPRYAHFLRTGDEAALSIVVEHNAIDVLSMLALVGLYGEPLDLLDLRDLPSLGHSFLRGKDVDRAAIVAERAKELGVGADALRLSARVAKARGDKHKALLEFEELSKEVSDAQVRLELSKLYEHVVKDHRKALEVTLQGTGESDEALAHRRARLERKLNR